MASLYPVKSGGWRIAYGPSARRKYTSAISSRTLAERMLSKIQFEEEAGRLGLVDPKAGEYARAERLPLSTHVKAWHGGTGRGLAGLRLAWLGGAWQGMGPFGQRRE